jgi:hypothetical protein
LGDWSDPWSWRGSVLFDNEEVAYVQAGGLVDASTRRQLAQLTLSRTSSSWWKNRSTATWRLSFSDGAEGPLRMMALAWLGVGFDLCSVDESD